MFEDLLQQILQDNEAIRFTNTYRGMPVSSNGRLVRIISGRAFFQTSKSQLLCMQRDHFTFLKSKSLTATVKARVVGLDWRRDLVELYDFTPVYNAIGNRALVRVEPHEPIPCTILVEETQEIMTHTIVEISLKGLAIAIRQEFARPLSLRVGSEVYIEYRLPVSADRSANPATSINYGGIVRNVVTSATGLRHRIGLEVFPDINTERLVIKYLAQRQVDLLKEIKVLSSEQSLI